MVETVRNWLRTRPKSLWVYPICLIVSVGLFFLAPINGSGFLWLYLGAAILFLFAFRPGSAVYTVTFGNTSLSKTLCTVLVALATIAACVLPMDQLPLWNGEQPGHRNQYELMAEAILDGRVDFAYGDEHTLSGLENPYDPNERKEAGVYYHWDHAYYNGHYYMYFGVVPVVLAFLPYRILTGTALTTYHATQLFAALSIVGIFVLFYMLAKLFFKQLPHSVYLALSVAFSVMSVWYSTAEPALYCTAITAAIMLEVWSLYFFIRAVWGERQENRQILFAGIGALLGALAFGCRPPIALANILVIPMLIVFLTQRRFTWKLLGKLVLAALPYAVAAAALMVYNYVRFDNPFEFGQAYQLTVADQTNYRVVLDLPTIGRLIRDTAGNFFAIGGLSAVFPYLRTGSVFWNFPVLLLGAAMLHPAVFKRMGQKKLLPLMFGLILTVLIITAADILWTPYLLERYRMDIYFLLGIGCFLTVGMWHNTCTDAQRPYLSAAAVALSAVTVVSAFLLCVYTIGIYYPGKITEIANALHLNG